MALKYFNYVLVNNAWGEGTFVTGIDQKNKQARWDENEAPLAMSKSEAEELAFCLTINGYYAVTVRSLHKIDYQRFNSQGANGSL